MKENKHSRRITKKTNQKTSRKGDQSRSRIEEGIREDSYRSKVEMWKTWQMRGHKSNQLSTNYVIGAIAEVAWSHGGKRGTRYLKSNSK